MSYCYFRIPNFCSVGPRGWLRSCFVLVAISCLSSVPAIGRDTDERNGTGEHVQTTGVDEALDELYDSYLAYSLICPHTLSENDVWLDTNHDGYLSWAELKVYMSREKRRPQPLLSGRELAGLETVADAVRSRRSMSVAELAQQRDQLFDAVLVEAMASHSIDKARREILVGLLTYAITDDASANELCGRLNAKLSERVVARQIAIGSQIESRAFHHHDCEANSDRLITIRDGETVIAEFSVPVARCRFL